MQKAKDETRQREVAARLRALRMELNYDQFEIADLVGISPQRWSYYETGKRQFDFDVAVTLCEEVERLKGNRALTLDYIYRGQQRVAVPRGFYRKLQKLYTTNFDLLTERKHKPKKRRKKSTRAKGEKDRA